MSDKLYVVYGAGSDSVGLVERIATGIADVGGNIIDLRQDVLHGLFTIYLVTDLSQTDLRLEQFRELIRNVGEDTGLDLHTAKYIPVARPAETRNLLVILLGRDRPGIVSRVSKDLSSHKINIEFSRTIAREGVFLMELLTDITHCTLPLGNLEAVVRGHMDALGINSMFQTRDVFNPKKRIVLFNVASSFIAPLALSEILHQAGIPAEDLGRDGAVALRTAASRLENLPVEVFNKIVAAVEVTHGTTELIQTLKLMGYRVALSSNAFSPVTDFLKERLGLDHAFGAGLPVDDDSQTIVGELGEGLPAVETERVVARLMASEGVGREDVSVIADDPDEAGAPPGLRMEFNMRFALDFLQQHVLSRESLAGILGSFGIPRVGRTS